MNRLIKIIVACVLSLVCAEFSFANNQIRKSLVDSLRKQADNQPAEVNKIIDGLIAKALAEKDSFGYARLLDAKGLAKRNTGDYAAAINSHHLAYEVYNAIGNKEQASSSLNSLGIIMLRTQQFDKAKNYFLQSLSFVSKTDTGMLKVVYTNLGVAYDYSDQTQLAIDTYKKAALYTDPKDNYSMGVSYLNIGVCYDILKDFKKSEEYFLTALKYQEKTNSDDLLARASISIGGTYLSTGKMDKAVHYLDIGGKAADRIKSVELEQTYYEHLIDLYVMTKDTKNAMLYIGKLNKLKAKIYNEENSKNSAEAEAKFNITLKNKEIENLKISKRLSDLQLQQNKWVRNVMLVIILLGLVLLFIVYRNVQLRKKNISLLEREKKLIENEKLALERNNEYLESQNMLARFEILKSQVSPHFLFNTLNALSYLIESDPEKAVLFTNAFSKLYRTILELKDQNLISLQQELNHVEAYFFLQQTRFGKNLVIEKQIDEKYFLHQLPPFSIQLAVENAINHNMATDSIPLQIKIYTADKFLVVENNLQPKTVSVKSTSIGIANIKSRYSFFTDINPEFIKTENSFVVKLPLLVG